MPIERIPVLSRSAIKHQVVYDSIGSKRSFQRTLVHEQDVEPILDANARLRGHAQSGSQVGGFKLAARIPEILYYIKWPQEFKEQHGCTRQQAPQALWRAFVLNKLNDPDFSKLRVDEGRL